MPQMTRGALMKVSAAGAMGWAAGMANVARAGGETPISEILGCPTDRTMCLNIQGASALEAYVEYGTGSFDARTPLVTGYEGGPTGFCLEGLQPDTRYGYRTRYRVRGASGAFATGPERTFHTQRLAGNGFTFTVQGDSHPERAGTQFDDAMYATTLRNIAVTCPDLHVALGDDFSVDTLKKVTASTVEGRYSLQVPYFGLAGHSTPVFLVNGNHEQAARYLYDGTPDNVAVWAQTARNRHFAQPAPDGFYTGNTELFPYIGLLRNYFAWTWGDALFVVIDPYWSSPVPVDNVFGGGAKRADPWDITLGDAQYAWLSQTLSASTSRWKFVFAHHVNGTGRGGADIAGLYEWGGRSARGVWEFDRRRPGWAMPIHNLMASTGVTVFFQGHDHIFVRQQLDGVTYQTMPSPADPTSTLWNAEAFASGDRYPGSGHAEVSVSSERVEVRYVRSKLALSEGGGIANGAVQFGYSLPA
ncbi:hypothetical protein LBMAG38_15730 [Chloroflexota bacterium]|nr:hypothetical protein LBMAG38_15730 [Chloroflexota bacterium]